MRLHVLTAVSRPENLPLLAESIAAAATPDVDICWHWRFDPGRRNIGGQALKNAMMDEIDGGWVYVLDDDTLMHPHLPGRVSEVHHGYDAVIVSQKRSSGAILHAAPENVCVGGIDIGQAIVDSEWIAGRQIPEDYNGDGMWLQAIVREARVRYLDEVLSRHNALTGVEVSA